MSYDTMPFGKRHRCSRFATYLTRSAGGLVSTRVVGETIQVGMYEKWS